MNQDIEPLPTMVPYLVKFSDIRKENKKYENQIKKHEIYSKFSPRINYPDDISDFLPNDEDMQYFVRIESHMSPPDLIKRKKIKKKLQPYTEPELPFISNVPSFKRPKGLK